MLVLTRKPGQGLLIGENIVVHLLRDESGDIKVAIDAPREINVARLELLNNGPRKPVKRPHR